MKRTRLIFRTQVLIDLMMMAIFKNAFRICTFNIPRSYQNIARISCMVENKFDTYLYVTHIEKLIYSKIEK